MKVVDVTPPCTDAMVAFSHVKHLAGKFGKAGIHNKKGLKATLREAAPQIKDVVIDVQILALVVVHGKVEDIVAISIAINKLILKSLQINLIHGPHKRQGYQATNEDLQSGLLLGLDAQETNGGNRVTLLLL